MTGVILIGLFCLCVPGGANAADPVPSCESIAAQYPGRTFSNQIYVYRKPPKQLSWGTRVSAGFDPLSEEIKTINKTVTFSAANPNRPISHPFTKSLTNGKYPSILFEEGDGIGRVTFSLVQDWSGEDYDGNYVSVPPCSYSRTFDVKPIRGTLPDFKNWSTVDYFGYSSDSELLSLDYYRPELCKTREDWLISAKGRILLTVRGFGKEGKVSLPDPCELGEDKSTSNRFWKATTQADGFKIVPRTKRTGTGEMTFRISFQGRRLFGGSFRLKTKVIPVKVIPEGTDAFINVCINYLQTIYSKNGRLYCSVGGKTTRNIQKLRTS